MADNSKKRKQPLANTSATKSPRFPPKPSRNIATTPTTNAYPNGELNVSCFMRAHENEIKALETAMIAAKKGLSRRAFQHVPRDMRRRTGSHNPQRVPRRMRPQARKEAQQDNTPISKGKSGSGIGKGAKSWLRKEGIKKRKKAKAKRNKGVENNVTVMVDQEDRMDIDKPEKLDNAASKKVDASGKRKKFAALAIRETPPARFRRRQVHKTWLPTHLFHTKRATMTPPKEPLWRFAIPVSPATKVYRAIHRASSQRGAVAWDMSYVSTISLEGTEVSISNLLNALRFALEDDSERWQGTTKARMWRNGIRTWDGWIYQREGKLPKQIAIVTVIWNVREDSKSGKRKAFIRVHPSAFLQLWNEVIRVAKVQKPAVTVEDLRFEIGAIEIIGPAALEALCTILAPTASSDPQPDSPQALWPTLVSITDPRSLPSKALLAFSISDPRLHHPPKTSSLSQDDTSQIQLLETLANWPIDQTQTRSAIFDRNARLAASRSLPSQRSINRRKGAASIGQYPEPRPADPQIPILTYSSRKSNSWIVLLPWKCVSPVWRCLMQYPISTGGTPRFGGLKERRQVDFEKFNPSFPFDYPGTDAGWGWELHERVKRQKEWTQRPKGKRIEWTAIDLGNGRKGEVGDPWACAWEQLLPKISHDDAKPSTEATSSFSPLRQLPPQQAADVMAGKLPSPDCLTAPHVITVKVCMVQRGVPAECARIYRIPTRDAGLRGKWLSLLASSLSANSSKANRRRESSSNRQASKRHGTRELAASFPESVQSKNGQLKAGTSAYPIVPDETDLIGFITSGNFNLAAGKPTAVANLVLQRVLHDNEETKMHRHACIVREAGQSLGRLATWEIV